jgi:subtilisin family serine protease
MKKTVLFSLLLVLAALSMAHAERRDVNAIAMKALRGGELSVPAKGPRLWRIPPGASFGPGQLLVRFALDKERQVPGRAEKNRILRRLGGASIEREFDLVPGLTLVKLPSGQTVNEDTLKCFNRMPEILYAEPDYGLRLLAEPSDPNFADLWGLEKINAPEAWDVTTGSSDIIVALIDTGVEWYHSDLKDNMWTNEAELHGEPNEDDDGNGYKDDIHGYDFRDDDGDPDDHDGHGTWCAGIIGAVGDNGTGVTGVCWDVAIMALRAGDMSARIAAIEYATKMGAHVINASWEGRQPSTALKNAIDTAEQANILLVVPAGNDYNNNDEDPRYPAGYDCNNIIAVLATDKNDDNWCLRIHTKRAVYEQGSNYGPDSVDLGAPGVGILSCWAGADDRYNSDNGTSASAPFVAGACALLWSVDALLTYQEVKDIIMDNVDVVPDLNEHRELGRLCVSGGRLNVGKAVNDPRLKRHSPAAETSNDVFASFGRKVRRAVLGWWADRFAKERCADKMATD